MRIQKNKGMTLMEILVVLFILGIISAITWESFVGFNQNENVDRSSSIVVASLSEARTLALSSRNALQYGVHFASTSVTVFPGSTYTGAATTSQSFFPPGVALYAVNLTGGGVDVVFDQLTGKTAQIGTLTVRLISNLARTKTITIYRSGLSERN